MDQLFFTISFQYDIIPGSLHVFLSADIAMSAGNTCTVRNIRRVDTDESPLLPVLNLKHSGSAWVHSEGEKESNISKAIGGAIELYLQRLSKSPNEMKGR